MRYVREGPFEGWDGPVKDDDGNDMTVGGFLRLVSGAWAAQAGIEATKTIEGIERLQKARMVLLEEPDADGDYAFENADFETLKAVVKGIAPFLVNPRHAMNAPQVMRYLEQAAEHKPPRSKVLAEAEAAAGGET